MSEPRQGSGDSTEKPSIAGGFVAEVVNPMEFPGWDSMVVEHPEATFFHSTAWARVLSESYAYTPLYLVLRSQGSVLSALPMMEVKSLLTGKRGISLPFTDECPPLGTEAAAGLLDGLLKLSEARRWDYFECRGGSEPVSGAKRSTTFYGHRLDLRPGVAAIYSAIPSSTRRAVRKAEQSGLSIEFSGDLDTVRAFHDLLCKTRKRHGLPPQPFSFFRQIHKHVIEPGKGWVAIAKKGETPVAGAVFFNYGATSVYKYGASDEAYQHMRPNNLVMWSSIQRLCQDGIRTLDFGRTSQANEGLRRFKQSWGTVERTFAYYRYDCRIKSFVASGEGLSGWHNRLFRTLPEPLSRLIGSLLYKHAA